MGNSAKAVSGVAVEAGASGLQVLLTPTLISALPASLTTPIPGAAVTGMRLAIAVYNHTTAGTLTITGTAPLTGAVVNETTSSIPVAENPGEVMWYTTTNLFATVGASGVTIGSGLAGATIVILGIQGAKRMIAGDTKLMDKTAEYSPLDQRGVFDRDFHLLKLKVEGDWEFQSDLYPTDAMWIPQGGYNSAPTVTSIPAAPASLLTSSAIAATGGNASLTTQPTAPGMVIGVQLGGTAPTTAGTVTISGVDEYGQAITEVVVPSTKVQGTYYSANRFASVNANGVVATAFGTGATITLTGVFGWQIAGNPGDTLSSFALEQYDSTGSFAAPYCLVTEWSDEGGMDKEYKIQAKGICQSVFGVGDPTQPANQITAFAQVIDRPVTGYRTLVYIDAIGGTPGSTQQGDVMEFKVNGKIGWTSKYTSWAPMPSGMWNRAYRSRREVDVEVKADMTNATYASEYQAFKRRITRLLTLTVRGGYLGTDSGTAYYQGRQYILPVKWIEEPAREFSAQGDNVTLTLKGKAYLLPSLGYSHKLTQWVTQPAW